MLFKCTIILTTLVVTALARTAGTSQNTIHDASPRSEESNTYFGDLRYVYKVYQECSATDLVSCLKLKLIAAIDRAARAYPEIPLFDGVTFVKDPKAAEGTTEDPKTEADIEASLPRALEERDDALNNLMTNKIANFFETHTLKVKLPTASELQRSFNGEEGRGKKKKSSGFLLLPLILGGTLIPLALGALALLAGKALIVSKLALVLAAIIGLKKLLSGHGGGHDTGHVEVVSGGHGSGWGRAYNKEEAQNLAYQAYASKVR
ncbi:hypothetical protein NQ318_017210 [Aromia moschata]|uniref:Uncharacterized protein n=1 Tax=Aromia moschata TaxID=1265417 RepID=A0AAV8YM37_9CUCU|nr:hypothetical protein NQ318_017210 [Aromia moschata]